MTKEEQDAKAWELLKEASSEIKRLRAVNINMRNRLQIYDDMVSLFNGGPRQQGGMECRNDIALEIDKHVYENTGVPQ